MVCEFTTLVQRKLALLKIAWRRVLEKTLGSSRAILVDVVKVGVSLDKRQNLSNTWVEELGRGSFPKEFSLPRF